MAEAKASMYMSPNRYTKRRTKEIWEVIERSLPILIETRATRLNLRESEVWFVRVMFHKVRGKCIDIRLFNKMEDDVTVWYEPTETGLTLTIEEWSQIFDPLFKLYRKYKEG